MRRILRSLFALLAIAGVLLTTACSGTGATQVQSTPTAIPAPAQATKPTYTVKRGDITAQVQFSARVIPAKEEELFFRADGRVRKIYVRGGDTVKQGQVLADLVSLDTMEGQAAQQKVNLRRSQINYEMAWLRQQLAATKTPNWDNGYDIEMKMQQYEVELAQLALEETQLQAKNLETAISDAQITSPMDGKVLNINLIAGGEVHAFSPMITVGDDSQLEIGATLTSNQMQDLTEGLKANIELPDRPGQKLTGKVRSLPYPFGTGGSAQAGSTAEGAGKSTDTATRISLDDPSVIKNFRLGELVDVTVVRESKIGVLWLPPAAIRTYEGRRFVVIKTDGLPRRADVKVGIENIEQVEILEGVEEGQVVVSP